MKKFLLIFVFLLAVIPLTAKEYVIETSRGPQTLTLPEGMSFEEAFLEMAELYLEERFDHEDLIEESQKLTEDIKVYIDKNEELENLYLEKIQLYENLERLYKQAMRIRIFIPTFNIASQYNIESNSYSVQGMFGGILFEKFEVQTVFSFPLGVGLSIGVQF